MAHGSPAMQFAVLDRSATEEPLPVVTWARCRCGEVLFDDSHLRPAETRRQRVLYLVCPKCRIWVAPDSLASWRLRRDVA